MSWQPVVATISVLRLTPDDTVREVARITYFWMVMDNRWDIDLNNIRSPKLNFLFDALAFGSSA